MEEILQIKDLRKRYKSNEILCGINMTINKGDIYGFVGKNGAGKTTLIRVISGLADASGGEFSLFGVSSKSKDIVAMRRKVCTMVESPSIYLSMTAYDNMMMQCITTGADSKKINEILGYVGLAETGKKKAKDFSLGMRQRLGIAMSLVNEPELMLLDEPINGLDPEGIKQIRELLLKLNKEKGITILISSHILTELSLFATRFGFIDHGVMIKESTIDEIKKCTNPSSIIKTSDDSKAMAALKYLGYDATEGNGCIIIESEINLTKVCLEFEKNGIELLSHERSSNDLEDYFMNLIKEAK